jgi:hypothetical protein
MYIDEARVIGCTDTMVLAPKFAPCGSDLIFAGWSYASAAAIDEVRMGSFGKRVRVLVLVGYELGSCGGLRTRALLLPLTILFPKVQYAKELFLDLNAHHIGSRCIGVHFSN